jgi:hypothetical protein
MNHLGRKGPDVKLRPIGVSKAMMFIALLTTPLLSGCGDFWQAPNGTSTSTGTTASSTTLTAASGSLTVDESVLLTATVSPTAATGTVTFYNGTVSIGTGALSSGTATLSTSFSAAGTESITATYGGNSTYESSTSGAVSISVTTAAAIVPTTTAIEVSNAAPAKGESVTLTAKVSPADASGVVTFYDAVASPSLSIPLGTATLNSGTATLSTAFETDGTHRILATYGGSDSHADSTTIRALDINIKP